MYEPGSFRPLAQIRQLDTLNKSGELERGKPELHYAITDMAGNVKELYQWRLERSPKPYFEEAILDPLHCDLRHQGQIVDEETGLYYNRHRYYDPQICQYLSPDPIGLAGGTRPQAYVHNPLEWVDPLGLIGLNDKGWSLYHIMKGDKVVYVGITKDVLTRMKDHQRSGRLTDDYILVEKESNLTYAQARGYEQADIERFGTLDTSQRGVYDANGKLPAGAGNRARSYDPARLKNEDDKRAKAFESHYKDRMKTQTLSKKC